MKRLLIALLLVSTPLFAQTTRDVQKKASRQTANVETLTADKTLSYLDAETQLLTPSGADRTVTLPSANVWKAWTVELYNESTSYNLVVKSSDGDTIDTVSYGKAKVVARQATPTDGSHWKPLGLFAKQYAVAGSYTLANGSITLSSPIADYVNTQVPRSGNYLIAAHAALNGGGSVGNAVQINCSLRTGSGTVGSATVRSTYTISGATSVVGYYFGAPCSHVWAGYLSAGDWVHLSVDGGMVGAGSLQNRRMTIQQID